jgi:hypothetical protein
VTKPKLLASYAAVAALSFAVGACAQGRFPNIEAAQSNLAAALDSLSRAPDRFGGHRVAAMNLIRQAQGELVEAVRNFR